MIFAFDVDGTLTPSRQKMDEEFRQFFINFAIKNHVFLVTGSDYPKTEEQVGAEVCNIVDGIFNCCGNVLTIKGKEIYRNDFELTEAEEQALINELYLSGYHTRTGNHIEKRIGLVNFSIPGRNADWAIRQSYIKWDTDKNERYHIAERLNKYLTRFECVVGGETGIDIFLKDRDKSQIIEYTGRPLIFFGDRCEPKGNDHTLAMKADVYFNVRDWQETFSILQEKYNDDY